MAAFIKNIAIEDSKGNQVNHEIALNHKIAIGEYIFDGTADINIPDTALGGDMELTMAEYQALSEEEKMNGLTYYITDVDGNMPVIVITKEEYDALGDEKYSDGNIYLISDDVGDWTATGVVYDNKVSGLEATNVGAALDELDKKIEDIIGGSFSSDSAEKDGDGNIITETYETKTDANQKLIDAKAYADNVKNDLLNGAGEAYDTLKELGELIDENKDALEALEEITNKTFQSKGGWTGNIDELKGKDNGGIYFISTQSDHQYYCTGTFPLDEFNNNTPWAFYYLIVFPVGNINTIQMAVPYMMLVDNQRSSLPLFIRQVDGREELAERNFMNWNKVISYNDLQGAISTVLVNNLTPSQVLTTDTNGKISTSNSIPASQLNYLKNVKSDIQTQLDEKQSIIAKNSFEGDVNTLATKEYLNTVIWIKNNCTNIPVTAYGWIEVIASNDRAFVQRFTTTSGAVYIRTFYNDGTSVDFQTDWKRIDATLKTLGIDATATELNYVDGVSSPIQDQLDAKAPTVHNSEATTYGAGSQSKYGHVKLINNLNSSEYVTGEALSAYQGSVIKGLIDKKQDTITGTLSNYIDKDMDPSLVVTSNTSGKLSVASGVTTAEVKTLAGIDTSSTLKSQLNAKQSLDRTKWKSDYTGDIDILRGADNCGGYWVKASESSGGQPWDSGYYHLYIPIELNGRVQYAQRYNNGRMKSRAYVNSAWQPWTSDVVPNSFTRKLFNLGSVTLAAGETKSVGADITYEGYTPLAIASFNSGQVAVSVPTAAISGNIASLTLFNTSSNTTVTTDGTAIVILYVAN